jgi:hypothetical protein
VNGQWTSTAAYDNVVDPMNGDVFLKVRAPAP